MEVGEVGRGRWVRFRIPCPALLLGAYGCAHASLGHPRAEVTSTETDLLLQAHVPAIGSGDVASDSMSSLGLGVELCPSGILLTLSRRVPVDGGGGTASSVTVSLPAEVQMEGYSAKYLRKSRLLKLRFARKTAAVVPAAAAPFAAP